MYYESRNREVKRRLINEGRYDERLKDVSFDEQEAKATIARVNNNFFIFF